MTYIICGEYDITIDREPGSVMTNCCKCDLPLWIAPSGLKVAAEKGAEPICMPCGAIEIQKDKERGEKVELNPLTEEQKKYVLERMGPEMMKIAEIETKKKLGLES